MTQDSQEVWWVGHHQNPCGSCPPTTPYPEPPNHPPRSGLPNGCFLVFYFSFRHFAAFGSRTRDRGQRDSKVVHGPRSSPDQGPIPPRPVFLVTLFHVRTCVLSVPYSFPRGHGHSPIHSRTSYQSRAVTQPSPPDVTLGVSPPTTEETGVSSPMGPHPFVPSRVHRVVQKGGWRAGVSGPHCGRADDGRHARNEEGVGPDTRNPTTRVSRVLSSTTLAPGYGTLFFLSLNPQMD